MADFSLSGGAGPRETLGLVTASTDLTTVASGGVAHTKGDWVPIPAATTTTRSGWLDLFVRLPGPYNIIMDVGIGATGSELIIIPDLLISNSGSASYVSTSRYNFPIMIPAGSLLSVKTQAYHQNAAQTYPYSCMVGYTITTPNFQNFPPLTGAFAMGASTVNTEGATLHSGAHTKGSYVELLASTPYRAKYVMMVPGSPGASVGSSWSRNSANKSYVDIAIGTTIIMPDIPITLISGTWTAPMLFQVDIPAASQVQARAQNPSATISYDASIALYGIY